MATISIENVYLKNIGHFKKKVTYSGGMFKIKLPEQIVKDLNLNFNDSELCDYSENGVNEKFSSKLKEWDHSVSVEEKIILFKANFHGALLKEDYWEHWHGGVYKPYQSTGNNFSKSQGCWDLFESQMGFSYTGLGIQLTWGVFNKKTVNGKSEYDFLSGRQIYIRKGDTHDCVEIPYTFEREAFFLSLDESFARMITKIHKSLGDLTPEKLLLIADGGKKLIGNIN